MAQPPYPQDESFDAEELELLDNEEHLPWLEADEEEEREGGFATSRLVLLAALSFLVVGTLVAAAWFAIGASSDEPPADGSLVEAPEGPYKTKPENAGGKTYAGTGDTSFAVGEGQTREAKLAEKSASPAPKRVVPGPSLATTLDAEPPQAERPGTYVQVGAYPSRSDAQEAWARLLRQTTALSGVRSRVVQAQVDIGTVYRLQAVTGSSAEARALCGRLTDDGIACFVK